MANLDPTGLLGILLAKLVDQAIDEVKNIYQCDDKSQALDSLLKNIRPMVSDVAARLQTGASATVVGGGPVKEWLENLERVFDKAELEVSQCKEIRRYNLLNKWKMSKRISKITKEMQDIFVNQASVPLLCVGVRTNETADEIKQRAEEINQKVDEIKGVLDEVNDRDVRAHAQQMLDNLRQLPDKIFGTDAPLTNLENLLLGETENKWIGVYGRGGIGKTLLAERVFNSKRVRTHFQNQLWLTVGQKPSIEQLQKNLAGQMKVDIEDMVPADAKAKLFNALQGKKVLLLLDDVWEDGVPVLESLDITRDTDSKILVTTRHVKVLTKRHALDESIVRMESLTENESWELFCEHAFMGVDNIPPQLDEGVAKAVAAECKGLPLALKVTAGALAHEESPAMWKRQLKKLKEAQPLDLSHKVELYGNLQLSYDSLAVVDPRLQKCFIYFAAFPEDWGVDSEELAKLWAGEKLLQAGDDADADWDPSVECFYLLGELMERSLIDLGWSDSDNPLHIQCRIHDVLRDFARYLISEKKAPMDCLFRAGEGLREVPSDWLCGPPRDVTHLSLCNNPLVSLPNNLKAAKLEVLLCNDYLRQRRRTNTLFIPPEFFESFSNLKVLNLQGREIESLPESVGSLKNLIHLGLSHTGLRKLPHGLQQLTKLEYLSLQHCKDIEPWPFDISHLESLSTLLTDWCQHIWQPIPATEHRRICDSLDSLCKIAGLRNLTIHSAYHEKLPSRMFDSLSCLANFSVHCPKLASLPNIHALQQLVSLEIRYCHTLSQLPIGFTKKRAFPNLQRLRLAGCSALQLMAPIEEGAFPKLIFLSLQGCSGLVELPSGFIIKGAFPRLESLYLNGCSSLHHMPPIEEGAFPKLSLLWMRGCSSLKELPSGFTRKGAFPRLETLGMSYCTGLCEFPSIEEGAMPQLEKLDLNGCHFENHPANLCHLGKLVELDLTNCRQLKNLDGLHLPGKGSRYSCGSSLASLQQLRLGGVDLKILPLDLHVTCPALETLDLRPFSTIENVVIPENLQILEAKGKLTILK